MGSPRFSGTGTAGLYYTGELGGNWPGAEETLTTQREDESHGRPGKGRGSAHAHVHSVQAVATEPKRQHWLWCPLRPRQDARRKPVLPPPELTWNMHTTSSSKH